MGEQVSLGVVGFADLRVVLVSPQGGPV